jgi:peptidyl-tRNA hydrolase
MKLYVVLLDTLTGGHVAAQCAHAVAEIHAREPGACAAWRAASNTVVVLQAES